MLRPVCDLLGRFRPSRLATPASAPGRSSGRGAAQKPLIQKGQRAGAESQETACRQRYTLLTDDYVIQKPDVHEIESLLETPCNVFVCC